MDLTPETLAAIGAGIGTIIVSLSTEAGKILLNRLLNKQKDDENQPSKKNSLIAK